MGRSVDLGFLVAVDLDFINTFMSNSNLRGRLRDRGERIRRRRRQYMRRYYDTHRVNSSCLGLNETPENLIYVQAKSEFGLCIIVVSGTRRAAENSDWICM
jgi:hypothetical protein